MTGPTLVCLLCGAELDVGAFLAADDDEDIFFCPRCDRTAGQVPDPDSTHVAA